MKSQAKSRSSGAGNRPMVVRFEDHVHLPSLFGEFDQNLARIEQTLGVTLSTRGNTVSVTGSAAATARDALRALYARLEEGLGVDRAEVDAAVRMALSGATGGAGGTTTVVETTKRHVTPRSPGQQRYVDSLRSNDLVFGIGPAGTGKTYIAVAMAVSMMIRGEIDRIILSRPAVEAGERLGFLPGDMREKVDPYLRPLYDALYDMLPADLVVKKLNNGEIEVAPLAFMRGRTLSNAFVILDEAQNTTHVQMKMFLTRIGENSRMVVTGDLSQVDLPAGTESGLSRAVETVGGIEGVSVVRFTDVDVVRHSLVTRIVRAYDEAEGASKRAAAAKGGRQRK